MGGIDLGRNRFSKDRRENKEFLIDHMAHRTEQWEARLPPSDTEDSRSIRLTDISFGP